MFCVISMPHVFLSISPTFLLWEELLNMQINNLILRSTAEEIGEDVYNLSPTSFMNVSLSGKVTIPSRNNSIRDEISEL